MKITQFFRILWIRRNIILVTTLSALAAALLLAAAVGGKLVGLRLAGRVLGWAKGEAAGVVTAIGEGVEGFAVGDEVLGVVLPPLARPEGVEVVADGIGGQLIVGRAADHLGLDPVDRVLVEGAAQRAGREDIGGDVVDLVQPHGLGVEVIDGLGDQLRVDVGDEDLGAAFLEDSCYS